MGRLNLPDGVKVAVNLGLDFDAQSIWMGSFNVPTPAHMARGEYGAEVGVPRILELFRRHGVRSTFFTPGHTVETFPAACAAILADGHEIGAHGYYHELPARLARDTERRLLERAMDAMERVLGIRPAGYRSPAWDHSEHTLDIIEELGFAYDSSLMARDLVPYRPRRWLVRWESASVAGPASRVLELPVSWYLDDFPTFAFTGAQMGNGDTEAALRRWTDTFDYAYERVEGPACYVHAAHPQIIGQPHHIMVYERLIEHMASRPGTWFCTCADIAAAWVDDDEDRRLMALPDVRGVDAPPADSGLA